MYIALSFISLCIATTSIFTYLTLREYFRYKNTYNDLPSVEYVDNNFKEEYDSVINKFHEELPRKNPKQYLDELIDNTEDSVEVLTELEESWIEQEMSKHIRR